MMKQLVAGGQTTIEELLKLALCLEVAARRFYEGLAARFSHCPEVAVFWQAMAADEACHENRLKQWRTALSAERLSQTTDGRLFQMGEKLLAVSVEELLRRVRTLSDAYEIADELESSETNTIFRFFIQEFSQDARVLDVLMQDLDGHVERLIAGFPASYATERQRAALRVA